MLSTNLEKFNQTINPRIRIAIESKEVPSKEFPCPLSITKEERRDIKTKKKERET
jgi:hypothetical protein